MGKLGSWLATGQAPLSPCTGLTLVRVIPQVLWESAGMDGEVGLPPGSFMPVCVCGVGWVCERCVCVCGVWTSSPLRPGFGYVVRSSHH